MALYIYIYNKYLLQNYAIYRFNLQDNKYEKKSTNTICNIRKKIFNKEKMEQKLF